MSNNVEILCVVGSAFFVTVSLSNTLKYLFKHEEFAFPLFVTCMHMLISYVVAYIAIRKFNFNKGAFRTFSLRAQIEKISPIALCTAVSMGCSNVALKTLFPSFVSMVTSAMPLVTIALSLVLKTEQFNNWTYISMVPIFTGLAISSKNEVNFDAFGFSILCLGIVLRAMKQVLQAKILRHEGKIDAITLLYYVAPQNCCVFFIWSLSTEGLEPYRVLPTARWQTWATLIVSTVFAAAFNLLSFKAISLINATAWSLMGLVNAPAITLLSWCIFGNYVSSLQLVGFSITLGGVYLYQKKGRVPSNVDRIEERRTTQALSLPKNKNSEVETLGTRADSSDEELDEMLRV